VADQAGACELNELLLPEYAFVRANNAYEALKNINQRAFGLSFALAVIGETISATEDRPHKKKSNTDR